ncbi:iron uptake system protein EfeO [Modicisalibacter tunisiensis]|uniref:Cupredoxin domain-containing protein n=1 Tax=Modicisalibacter tunisiensis TaxID=390637 RepID=A0ABS7WXR4_9GAMM|nr:iron uptake system protein EfeO [Modicisalibacter tunisiensis]MBZ9567008.1 cupredoxin domain-containing protein [Modicisalibacter tunisiensis]
MSQSTPPSSRLLRLGVPAAAAAMLAALGLFALSLDGRGSPDAGTRLVVTAEGCRPETLSVPAGDTTFTLVNDSERAIEWEILDGVMVLEERENIAPGLHQPLTARLAPGDYTMTCGLLSNPRGTLHVTANDEAAPVARLARQDFVAALAEYKVYLTLQGRRLTDAADTLREAIVAGDLETARAAYRRARLIDQRLAMATGLFSDLDQRLNAHADDFARRENDPRFVGFHRLAHGLFTAGSTEGLAPVAAQLVEDVRTLTTRLRRASIPPAQLAEGSARALQVWLDHSGDPTADQSALDARERRDLHGLTQGADKIVSLLDPLLERRAPTLRQRLHDALDTLQKALTDSTTADGADRDALVADTRALVDALQELNPALALNG